MRFVVIGSGMMGTALAFDLVHSPGVTGITLLDSSHSRIGAAVDRLHSSLVKPIVLDLDSPGELSKILAGHDCAISAVPYRYNVMLTEAALDAGIHFCDLGGNDEVVGEQLRMHDRARERNLLILPNCGLAPGLVNILAARGAELFDSIEEIQMRVGGLPQHPRPPLNYQLLFSVEGLLNEYSGKARVLRRGTIAEVDAMSEVEVIEFPPPFGTLEAFHTSGGSSRLAELLQGRVQELDYKTIRYRGHCERMKALLELGYSSSEPIQVGHRLMTTRELFMELLKKRLSGSDTDATLLRVVVTGAKSGKRESLRFELIDSYDRNDNISSMGRTTAFPASAIAQMAVAGVIRQRGVLTPEECVPLEPLLTELKRRDLNVSIEWT